MGLVSQDCLLFHGTIEDNIRYGTEQATSEQVVEAAKSAYAHEFILAMPYVSAVPLSGTRQQIRYQTASAWVHLVWDWRLQQESWLMGCQLNNQQWGVGVVVAHSSTLQMTMALRRHRLT
jgi:hypothetical protein